MGMPLSGGPTPVTVVEVSKELKLRGKRKMEKIAVPKEATATSSAAKVGVEHVRGVCKFCDKPLTIGRAFNDHEKDGSKFERCPLDPKPPPDSNAAMFTERVKHEAR
ncbi:hypothetical protein Pmar_PMAR023940 [Perkinsus marinus ATCC 50983]|uniref:Uncharacterized protein n=1 Tax=Perkinsus marinus (strain ATCC 50983 / TXsc) TaxID=423536 RepID=C5LWA6_PERM5|nr:hypothetical protein Pmar_PMAR023940 [Perkinsus marinus ATCC 50983]EEQ98986.1 hypothetical protein Pmar_PMAR023940 [Perkinsus marinus ATCC 50983]|eukprot:XP_002766269.1 hypothetical protein Pmar_PMAR023940 [Perkinsus marinus ATCC 50983]